MKTQAIPFIAALFLCSSIHAQILNTPEAHFKAALVDCSTSCTHVGKETQVLEAAANNGIIVAQGPEYGAFVRGGLQANNPSEWRKGWRFGVSAGPNISYFPTHKLNPLEYPFAPARTFKKDAESSRQLGFHVHGIIGYCLTEEVELEMRLGVLYSRFDGVRYTNATAEGSPPSSPSSERHNDTLSQQSTWLEMPLIFRLRPFKRKAIFLEAGATTGLLQKVEGNYSTSVDYFLFPAPSIFDDSGELGGGLQVGIYLGAGFRFLKRHQVSISWSARHIKSHSDGTVYYNRKLPIRIWRLTFDRYF